MTERPPSEPDDLAPWADDDLVRALRAPGTTTELADQEQYVAAFRQAGRSNVRSLPRRAVGRLGAGGTAVVVTVALTSGVAAAYTGHLPDPVQRIAHHVIGAPSPEAPGRGHPEASHGRQGPDGTSSDGPSGTSSTAPNGTPSSGATSGATPSAGTSPTAGGHSGAPGNGPSQSPGSPSTGPTTGAPTPATSGGAAAAAMTMSAPSHRVGFEQGATLSGLVTDASGTALPAHLVVLQVRGPRHWRPVEEVTSDDAGVATATTPAIAQSGRYRWHAGPGVHSTPWLLRMVPVVTMSAQVGGSTTTLTPTAQGSRPGDRIRILRHTAGRTVPIRRARLDSTGSTTLSVLTPRRRAAYVVVLLPTKRHAGARSRVVVTPPPAAAVSISGSATRVAQGSVVVFSGTVTSGTGEALPHHKVVLLRRGPLRWRPVGHALSNASGQVTITSPAILGTSRFRLRTDHRAHSALWRVVEQPTLSASSERTGTTTLVSASASGAHAGDKVVLLRRVDGRLVKLRHGSLDANGSVTFSVRARKIRTTYVVRLVATKRHGPAAASTVVPGG
ncbi:MAG: hypothetical protein QM747_21225 [Nocardioides sp.]